MSRASRRTNVRISLLRVFLFPIILFIISLSGLVAALLLEGQLDVIASLASGAGLVAFLCIRRI